MEQKMIFGQVDNFATILCFHRKKIVLFLNIGPIKVNLEFSFSYSFFSFSGLDPHLFFGFQTCDSLHISSSVFPYFSVIADCQSLV